jgi:hypothetical protein
MAGVGDRHARCKKTRRKELDQHRGGGEAEEGRDDHGPDSDANHEGLVLARRHALRLRPRSREHDEQWSLASAFGAPHRQRP